MQRKRHDAINKPHQLSSALLHMAISPLWDGEIKNTFISDVCFSFFTYSSFHTNDVFILEGFQSNQITMALPLIRHNRTLAGGVKTGERAGRTHFVILCKKWIKLSHYALSRHNASHYIWRVITRQNEAKELCCLHNYENNLCWLH